MSWRQAVEAPGVTSAASPAESARFALSVDRITVSATSGATEPDVLAAVRASAADVVIVRYPAEQVTWFASLAAAPQRIALLADSLVYWRLTAGLGRRPAAVSSITAVPVPGTAAGSSVAQGLVGEIFTDYRNHYLADPLFDRDRARAGYQDWAARSVASGHSIMLSESVPPSGDDPSGERAVGLCVGESDGVVYEILLAGVVPAAQGRGLYGHLLAAAEDRAVEHGLDAVVISTQSHNTRVQRAWARYGFEPVHALLTVHLLRPEAFRDAMAVRPVRTAATAPAGAERG